jgi:hypothetical protein
VKIGSFTNLLHKLRLAKAAIDKENDINEYSVGTLDVSVEPYVYFSAGKDTAVPTTKAPAKKTTRTTEKAETTTKAQ